MKSNSILKKMRERGRERERCICSIEKKTVKIDVLLKKEI